MLSKPERAREGVGSGWGRELTFIKQLLYARAIVYMTSLHSLCGVFIIPISIPNQEISHSMKTRTRSILLIHRFTASNMVS